MPDGRTPPVPSIGVRILIAIAVNGAIGGWVWYELTGNPVTVMDCAMRVGMLFVAVVAFAFAGYPALSNLWRYPRRAAKDD